ncbi:MAG: DUF6918 family protein [Stenotrophobium sp.]
MDTLTAILLAPAHKGALITDCVQLIESRVAGLSGFKGMAMKTGMSLLKAAKPGILERATARLLPEFVAALEPLHAECADAGTSGFTSFLQQHAPRATQDLLSVADRHVAESDSSTIKSAYAKLRGSAEHEVQAAIPGLAEVIGRYLS